MKIEWNGKVYDIDGKTKLKDLPDEVVKQILKLKQDEWERRKERSGNSKSEDEQRAKTEFVNPTKDEGDSPESPESPDRPGETGGTGEPKSSQVGLTNSENAKSDEKNRISAKLLDRDVVESEDGRQVKIEVYDTGDYREYVSGDKIVKQKQIKFVLKYLSLIHI